MADDKITITLNRADAEALREWVGARPASEDWSRTVWLLLGRELEATVPSA